MYKRKNVLIIGSSGYLGSSVVMYLASHANVTASHCTQAAFPNSVKFDFFSDYVEDIFQKNFFDIVIIAAKIEFGIQQNLLTEAMKRFINFFQDAHMIYVSSDGIFDGVRGMYTEMDVPEPITTYGENLAICEEIVKSGSSAWGIVRPSYIYGYSLGILDVRLDRMRKKLMVGVENPFEDMFKSPVEVNYAARAIADIALREIKGVIHLAGYKMSVYEFYKRSMQTLGISVSNLLPGYMPAMQLRKVDMLKDTSLDNTKMQDLFGSCPAIEEFLKEFH